MGLLEKLFGKEIYCQTCGELISDSGYLSDAKRAYHPVIPCLPRKEEVDNFVELRTGIELQKDIGTGRLVHYKRKENTQ